MQGPLPFSTPPNPDDEPQGFAPSSSPSPYSEAEPVEFVEPIKPTELPSVDEQCSDEQFFASEEQTAAIFAEQQELPLAPEDLLPPEAQGETNGGPLGCCLGITVGIMLSIFLGLIGLSHLLITPLLTWIHPDPIASIRIATGFFGCIGAIVGGYFGWKIGKRVYRDYEPPVIKDRGRGHRSRRNKAVPKEAK